MYLNWGWEETQSFILRCLPPTKLWPKKFCSLTGIHLSISTLTYSTKVLTNWEKAKWTKK